MDMLRWLVEEGNANFNTVAASGATPLLLALDAEVINLDVVRFLLSVGARVEDLTEPSDVQQLRSYAKASIQEEVQKLEVPSYFPPLSCTSISLATYTLTMCKGGGHRECDGRVTAQHSHWYCKDRGGVYCVV
jgi:ankyrin repeat protein